MTPSSEDISINRRLKEAGEVKGNKVQNHIIVDDNEYVSFVERGLL
jgi:DNA repair protein RadC